MVVPNAQVNYPISSSGQQVVSEVLSKLLTVGITDPGKNKYLFFAIVSCDTTEDMCGIFVNIIDKSKKLSI